MYKANDSIYKKKIREILLGKIERHVKGTQLEFLSLSNTSFELEKQLLDIYPGSKVECYECNKDVYDQALLRKPHQITMTYGDIFKIPKSDKEYSFIWLDLCNSYSDEVINHIIEFTTRVKLARKAIYAITLNRKRGKSEKDITYNRVFPHYKNEGFVNHITPFINGKVVSVDRIEYICRDISTAGGSMNLFIFKTSE